MVSKLSKLIELLELYTASGGRGGIAHIGNLIGAVWNSLSNGTFRFALSLSLTKILEVYKSFSNVSQCKKVFCFAYNSLNKHIFLTLNKSLVTLKICFLKKYILTFFWKKLYFFRLKIFWRTFLSKVIQVLKKFF